MPILCVFAAIVLFSGLTPIVIRLEKVRNFFCDCAIKRHGRDIGPNAAVFDAGFFPGASDAGV